MVLMCRRPRRGTGKRRLAAEVGDELAYQAARHMLACALEDLRAWSGPVVISPADQADIGWARRRLRDSTVLPQVRGNLGTRINALSERLWRRQAGPLVLIGSDAPALAPELPAVLAQALDQYDIALARADDGGVTAMAARDRWPELAPLPWGTDRLHDALVEACRAVELRVWTQGGGYDVDGCEPLLRAARELAADERPARQEFVAWLKQNRVAESGDGPDCDSSS